MNINESIIKTVINYLVSCKLMKAQPDINAVITQLNLALNEQKEEEE